MTNKTKETLGEIMDLKHFVTYYTHQTPKNKAETRQVESNEIALIKIPDRVFAIKIFDRASDDMYKDGKKIVSKNELLNEKTYYIGQILSLDQIKETFGENSQTYIDMINSHSIGAIKTTEGFIHPLSQNERFNLIPPELVGIVVTDFDLPALDA